MDGNSVYVTRFPYHHQKDIDKEHTLLFTCYKRKHLAMKIYVFLLSWIERKLVFFYFAVIVHTLCFTNCMVAPNGDMISQTERIKIINSNEAPKHATLKIRINLTRWLRRLEFMINLYRTTEN